MKDDDINKIKEALSKLQEEDLDDNLGALIDNIFDQELELEELKLLLTRMISEYLIKKAKLKKELKRKDEKDIYDEIEKFVDGAISSVDKKSKNYEQNKDNIQSRKNLKMIIKNFAVYQIYQVMNPRRIAGETKELNYMHNLIYAGKKVAQKYEGGKEADLAKYTEGQQKQMEQIAKSARQKARFLGR